MKFQNLRRKNRRGRFKNRQRGKQKDFERVRFDFVAKLPINERDAIGRAFPTIVAIFRGYSKKRSEPFVNGFAERYANAPAAFISPKIAKRRATLRHSRRVFYLI